MAKKNLPNPWESMMNGNSVSSAPSWYAIYTKLRQEDRAISNLTAWGVEAFTPKIRRKCINQYIGKAVYSIAPLFPRYIFARIAESDILHKVRFTRGVHSVVSFGGIPTPIDQQIISVIKLRMGDEGFICPRQSLKFGDKVVIEDGPMKDLVGVFEQELGDGERVRILLTAIGYQAHIVVKRDLVHEIRAGQ